MLGQRNTFLQGERFAFIFQPMELKDRLKQARKHARLTQAELAERSGIKQASVSEIERGLTRTSGYLVKFATICRVDPVWLSEGVGSMISISAPSNVAMIDQPVAMYRYPVVSTVAAGAWAEAVEPDFSDRYETSDYKAKGRAFWLEVSGDSMTAPSGMSVPEGMLILVDPGVEARPGKLVVAKLPSSNEATFKKLIDDAGQLYLKPLNPGYSMIKCTDDCKIIGVAVRVTGFL
ncbi:MULTISPECIES: LexA family protein [Pseudomonas syringae group genomosp. 2]|uniref:Peptidase n=2 Tax=Pseudomonas syringae group genomosp. 2 TaxID=251698 RepID=A0AAX1VMG4_PSEAJ|nr:MULTISPECIES: S24 family peptidase [Pseudomonas syringae group genomosp. 2]KPY79313.1 Peptidase [Pseudomonas amygdali pv. tabaci]QOI04448.1 helix-turn-helix domain-containing protein [Pseudomonas savastanoi]RML76126.1 Peptidase [Pseudomonas amygdali pv. tabaci]